MRIDWAKPFHAVYEPRSDARKGCAGSSVLSREVKRHRSVKARDKDPVVAQPIDAAVAAVVNHYTRIARSPSRFTSHHAGTV